MPWMPSEGHESVTHVILERMPFGSNLGKSFRWCQWWKVFHRQGLVKMMPGKQIGMKQLKSWWILMVPIGLEKSPCILSEATFCRLVHLFHEESCCRWKSWRKITDRIMRMRWYMKGPDASSHSKKDYGSPNIIWNNIHSYIGIKLFYIHVLYM